MFKTGPIDGDNLNWDEGNYGKGLIDARGYVHTWPTDEYELHSDYIGEHLGRQVPLAYFGIDPDGRVDNASDLDPLNPNYRDLISEADPRLYHGEGWRFG